MKRTPQDTLAYLVVHLQQSLNLLDDIGETELFKQDYKNLLKRVISETEAKMKAIYDSMGDSDKTDWFKTMESITSVYNIVDSVDVAEQAVMMNMFLESKIQ